MRIIAVLLMIALGAVATGCGASNTKKHYVLAEKLWEDGNYAAAVTEFEKVIAKDAHGKLGKQALLRAATTQAFFLSQYDEAIRKLKMYADRSGDSPEAWDAQKQIGELLYSKVDNYDGAIQHYRTLLKARPEANETPEFLYRIGKSLFFLSQFGEAIQTYQDIIKRFPQSSWAERALFELGVTYFTRGGQGSNSSSGRGIEGFQEAMDAYQVFIKRFPQSDLVPEAKFGIAASLEEMDQLDAAYNAFDALKATYPSPKVILIKMARIKERKVQRNR